MRGDLLDAYAAVEWGESQFPILMGRFRTWEAQNVRLRAVDLNPPTGKLVAVASAEEDLPAIFHAEVGAIIGSFRSALDLLAATLARRKGVPPSSDTHFPFFRSREAMLHPSQGIKRKKGLSAADVAVIESLAPYDGGNKFLWSLHQLDILRKHERLIACVVDPRIDYAIGRGLAFPAAHSLRDAPRLEDKPQMFEYPRHTPKPEAQISVEVTFDEASLASVHREPLFQTLVEFGELVRHIVGLFDAA